MTLGKQPSDWLWFMIENVPLMIAWLPTTEASIASPSTGHLTLSTNHKYSMNQFLILRIDPGLADSNRTKYRTKNNMKGQNYSMLFAIMK